MDGFLKVAGAAQVCQDDKLDEARRKQDAAQAAFSTLQTIGKYLSAIKRRITAFTKFYEASPPRDFSSRIADQTVLYFPDLSTEISSSFPWFEQQFKKGFSSWMRMDVTNVEILCIIIQLWKE